MPKGIPLEVFRSGRLPKDSPLLSNNKDRFVLVGDNMPPIAEADAKKPAMVLKERQVNDKLYRYLVPVILLDKWHMFGGNFAYGFGADYREIVGDYPLPIHDHIEE